MKRPYCLSIITLFVSLFIYLFYRTEKTLVNELVMLFLSLDTFTATRSHITETILLHESIIFSLPGGLWVFCTTALSKDLYIKMGNHKIQMVVVPILFAVGLEFCQLMQFTHGTFDRWDVGFYIAFWLVAYYGFQSHGTQQNILAPFNFNGFICLACFLAVYLAHVSH